MANEDFWDHLAEKLLLASYGFGFLFGLGLLGWQTYTWLRTGDWTAVPFLRAFEFAGINVSPVFAPTGWFGAAKLAEFVLSQPLAFMLPLTVIAIAHGFKLFISAPSAN